MFNTLEEATRAGLELSEGFRTGWPFPNVAIRDLWPSAVLEGVCDEFETETYEIHDSKYSNKLACSKPQNSPNCKRVLDIGNHSTTLFFLAAMTSIKDLHADPLFVGGGMHKHGLGGFLNVHTDFQYHPLNGRRRVLNMLLFLNKDWKDEWEGHLELHNQDLTMCARIRPEFNTTVIFLTNDTSYHGLPKPIKCPEGVTRKSLAWYFYSGEPSMEHARNYPTIWKVDS